MSEDDSSHLLTHVIPVLGRVYAGFERCGPGCGVDSGPSVLGTLDRLPIYEESDGVLGVVDTVVRLSCRDSGGCARYDPCGDGFILQDPAADINVMGGEVVATII